MKKGVKEKVFFSFFSYFFTCVKAMKDGVKDKVFFLFSPL